MLNTSICTETVIDGRPHASTAIGSRGHAVYGPYERKDPGDYAVCFRLENLADAGAARRGAVCGILDVVSNAGKRQHASRPVKASDFLTGQDTFVLPFTLEESAVLEYRVWTSGILPLLIDAEPRLVCRDANDSPEKLVEKATFPSSEGRQSEFFVENHNTLFDLYKKGCEIRVSDASVVISVDGISMHAASRDDLNFVGEVFFEKVYDLKSGLPLCLVDVGMNIGLSSLLFARKQEVVEVHAYEPFSTTYQRAMANLALNETAAKKIRATNVGLSDRDWSGEILVPSLDDSGAMSTIPSNQGTPVEITLRDAGKTLEPIIKDARARGLRVIVKMDCEGSEYSVFGSLEKRGLLRDISGFMVEWHAMFHDKTQETLIAPLRKAGYIAFDRSPPQGNGFFYAVRLES